MKRGECCDMRGLLSFLILFILSQRPQNGQEVSRELEKRKGVRPSPGTIYPALKSLKEAGFIKEKRKGKAVIYTLTPAGERALRASKEQFCRTFMGVR